MLEILIRKIQLVICIAVFAASAFALAENHTITMKSISFDPKVLEIKVGDSVEWINKSYTEHSATGEAVPSFDTGLIQPKKHSAKIEFSKAGTYSYHCSVHGKTMSAQVIVK